MGWLGSARSLAPPDRGSKWMDGSVAARLGLGRSYNCALWGISQLDWRVYNCAGTSQSLSVTVLVLAERL